VSPRTSPSCGSPTAAGRRRRSTSHGTTPSAPLSCRPAAASSCALSVSLTAPNGTEFDDTGCLVQGAEFSSLAAAPLRSGGTVDLGAVPGMVGWTDFVTGAV